MPQSATGGRGADLLWSFAWVFSPSTWAGQGRQEQPHLAPSTLQLIFFPRLLFIACDVALPSPLFCLEFEIPIFAVTLFFAAHTCTLTNRQSPSFRLGLSLLC